VRRAIAAACVILSCWTAPARANEPDATDALRLLEEGERLFSDDADYPAALDRFWRSYRLSPSARALNGIAVVHQLQGLYVEAFEVLERMLAEFEPTLTPRQLAQMRRRLAEMRGRIGEIELTSDQAGVRVSVDGRDVGRGPLRATVRVIPGSHTVVATLPGHDPLTRTLPVAAGGGASLRIALSLAKVHVERPVMVRRMSPWVPWTTIGAGALVVGGGFFLERSASGDLDDARAEVRALWERDQRPVDEESLPAYERAERKRAAAIGLWAAGGAAVVTGAVLAILNQPRPRFGIRHAPRVVPRPGGAALVWSF